MVQMLDNPKSGIIEVLRDIVTIQSYSAAVKPVSLSKILYSLTAALYV